MTAIIPPQRLADRVLDALTLAIEQGDIETADLLARALERSMTRNAGGVAFTERRTFSSDVEKALADLSALRAKN